MRRREFLLTPLLAAPVALCASADAPRLVAYRCESRKQLDTLARGILSAQPDALILEATAAAHLPQLIVVPVDAEWGGAPAQQPSSSSALGEDVARALSPQRRDSSRRTLYELRTYEQAPALATLRETGIAPMFVDTTNDAWTMLTRFDNEAERNAAWTHHAWLTRKTHAKRVREIVVAREWRG